MVNSTGISFSGLGSGLDTAAIVKQLVALERLPIQTIENKRDAEQNKLDDVRAFSKLVKALQEKADQLATSQEMLSFSATVSDASVAGVTASGAASAGTHTLEVLQLADQDRWAFDGVADTTSDLATADGQTVEFTIGGETYQVAVQREASDLGDIAAAINEAAGDVVDASIVNTGTESAPSYRLVLAAKESGEENRISDISSTITGLDITWSAPDANGDATSEDNITVGTNAIAVIDGLTVEKSSNQVSDVLEGVEIDLLATNVGAPINFTVGTDSEAVKARIQKFVTAYNEVVQFINKQSTYTPGDSEDELGTTEPLFGDSLLSSVRDSLRRALFDVDLGTVMDDTEGYSTLALVGIETASDGTLSINSTVLDEKLAENPDLFVDLFTDDDGFDNGDAEPNTPDYFTDTTADSGLMANLSREIDRMFGSFEGAIDPDTGERQVFDSLFDLKQDTLRTNIQDFEDRITQMERRLDDYEEDLILRFARLEELMGALNAQGAALNNALGNG